VTAPAARISKKWAERAAVDILPHNEWGARWVDRRSAFNGTAGRMVTLLRRVILAVR
jgi:hypothetical protein